MKIKPVLPFLETMITQVCNLACVGCTNYSDLSHKGYVTWKDGKEQLKKWLEIVDIPDFGIMGGEPLINPQVDEWLIGVRDLMPNAQIRFTTNGLLMHKHTDIIKLMHELGNVVFKITVHTPDDEILKSTIDDIFNNFQWTEVTEYGIKRWKTSNNLRLQINYPTQFLKTFKGDYNNMLPFDSTPSESFNDCIQQTCPLLYNGKIYKCSTAGLLKDTLNFNDIENESWKKHIDNGISTTDDINHIKRFVENFGKPNALCRQCPTKKDTSAILLHNHTTVTYK
jgi:hypothetical protein